MSRSSVFGRLYVSNTIRFVFPFRSVLKRSTSARTYSSAASTYRSIVGILLGILPLPRCLLCFLSILGVRRIPLLFLRPNDRKKRNATIPPIY
uniref:Putative secreted protein n=1 Tax=Ixodes ricinus TaxID=34613 RepID=A0A0K8RFM7_IXORI